VATPAKAWFADQEFPKPFAPSSLLQNPMRPSLSIWSMTALFAAAIVAAWAWFYVGVTPPEKSFVLKARENLPGYRFTVVPIGDQAIETLATTNLINGQFEGPDRQRFTVFAADWAAKGSKQMSVLGHTPEICWVGAGFQLTSLGEPPFMEVTFGREKLALECRVFRTPDQRSIEMVVWCSLVSGQPLEEGFRFQPKRDDKVDPQLAQASTGRVRGMNSLIKALARRQPGDGTKQFVRFSTPVAGDWKEAYQRLERFAHQWLELEVHRPRSVANN
jgi:hypothetical protein